MLQNISLVRSDTYLYLNIKNWHTHTHNIRTSAGQKSVKDLCHNQAKYISISCLQLQFGLRDNLNGNVNSSDILCV